MTKSMALAMMILGFGLIFKTCPAGAMTGGFNLSSEHGSARARSDNARVYLISVNAALGARNPDAFQALLRKNYHDEFSQLVSLGRRLQDPHFRRPPMRRPHLFLSRRLLRRK